MKKTPLYLIIALLTFGPLLTKMCADTSPASERLPPEVTLDDSRSENGNRIFSFYISQPYRDTISAEQYVDSATAPKIQVHQGETFILEFHFSPSHFVDRCTPIDYDPSSYITGNLQETSWDLRTFRWSRPAWYREPVADEGIRAASYNLWYYKSWTAANCPFDEMLTFLTTPVNVSRQKSLSFTLIVPVSTYPGP